MFRKILLTILLILTLPVYAIDWIALKSESGSVVELDVDSIIKEKGYYFYNIKFVNTGKEDVIITMQASAIHPYCARINYYKPQEYLNLNGDYLNISTNKTKNLEPVVFKSRAYAAYRKVDNIMKSKNIPKITF